MRHHWAIIIPKNKHARQTLPQLIESQLIPTLIWKPETVLMHETGAGPVVLSFSSNAKLLGYDKPYFIDDTKACLTSGLPTTEHFSSSSSDDTPRLIAKLVEKHTPDTLFNHLGGSWSIAHVKDDNVTVFADFCGYGTCYYSENDLSFSVSNKARFAACFARNITRKWQIWKPKPIQKYNYEALSWMFSTTMIQGHQTAFENVHKIKAGEVLTYNRKTGLSIRTLSPNYDTPLDANDELSRETYLKQRIEILQNRTRWYLDRGISLDAHITGGKDSRTILSLLAGSDRVKDIKKISTTGSEENGDVIIARRIAKKLGIEKQHLVSEGNKARKPPELPDILHGFFHSAFKYDGQLTPFDGRAKAFPRFPGRVAFMGGGGEIYRQKYYKNHSKKGEFVKQFTNWSYPYDALGILTRGAKNQQLNQLKLRADQFLNEDIKNHQAKYYIDHRLSNWGAGHFQAGTGNTLPLLLDIGLARLMFADKDMGENIHFDIIRHTCPDLLQVPFSNQRWAGATREKAQKHGCDIDPLKTPIAKNFPWQFQFYQDHRNPLIDIALEHFDSNYAPFINTTALEKIKSSDEPFGSAKIKMLFGLVMCQLCFSEDATLLTDPDTVDQNLEHLEGNLLNESLKSALNGISMTVRDSTIFTKTLKELTLE